MEERTYYNESAQICGKVMNQLQLKLREGNFPLDILELSTFGNEQILVETNSIYKKIKDKGIASPVSISLNNCMGNFLYDHTNPNSEFNKIKKGDIVKIDFGVSISGCIAQIGETFLTGGENDEKIQKSLDFLDTLPKEVAECMVPYETNDELRIRIESKCTENGVFPVENCISYEQKRGHIQASDSKYMILNYKKYYDDNDNLVSEQNLCFEFEENEVYTVELSVIPTEDEDDSEVKYNESDDVHMYRFNDTHYSLKLKSSRLFYSEVKSKHANYKFDISGFKTNVKHRMGINECYENNILDPYPIIFVKTKNGKNLPVLSKKFTVIVKDGSCYFLKYK
jgi:methionine aminopeptidase